MGSKSISTDTMNSNKTTHEKTKNHERAVLPIDLHAPLQLSNPKVYLCYAKSTAQCLLSNRSIASVMLSNFELISRI